MKKDKLWISDLIGDKYKTWSNEAIILDAGTGCGKTSFCLGTLTEYAESIGKTVLYLCNREKLQEQVEDEISQLGYENITVTTYQSIQEKMKRGIEIGRYDYILADECHYFITDALFNDFTDLAYNYIKNSKDSVVIFMSATAKVFFNHLISAKRVRKENVFTIHKNYDYVDRLCVYKKDQLGAMIDKIIAEEENSKIIVFCNAEKRMLEMYEKYGTFADYYCSRHSRSSKLKEICSTDCLETDTADGTTTFHKRILFTTSALDNGINLKDWRIKHIFSELFDIDTMVQAFGRKRPLNEEDTCSFYVKDYSPQAIQGMLNTNRSQLEPVRLYLKDYPKFCKKYGEGKDRKSLKFNDIFYMYFDYNNGKKKEKIRCNMMKYHKRLMDNEMLDKMKDKGYMVVALSAFGKELSDRAEIIDIKVPVVDEFMEYLKSIENKHLYATDREELKKKFESIGVKLRYTGINTFNGALDDCYKKDYTKRFINKDKVTRKNLVDRRRTLDNGNINPNRDKSYWLLC